MKVEKEKYPVCSSENEICPVKNLDKCIESLEDTEKEVLRRIFKNKYITLEEIHEIGGISQVAIKYQVEQLEEKGILRKNPLDEEEWIISKPCYKMIASLPYEKAQTLI